MNYTLALALTLGVFACAYARDSSAPRDATPASTSDAGTAPEPRASAITITQIQANGFVFDARTAGPETGELVLLLHGFLETSYEWQDQLSALGDSGYRAVAPDQRGYSAGARPNALAQYTLSLLAQDVLAIADKLGARHFHIVGHDCGASIAWFIARNAADRVISLSSLSMPHPDAFAAQLADANSCQSIASRYFDFLAMDDTQDVLLADDGILLRSAYHGIDDALIEEYMSVVENHAALRAALDWYRANANPRPLPAQELGSISVPTLFIWGDEDLSFCRESAELSRDYVRGPCEFAIIAGVDHFVVDRAPQRVSELLVRHLKSRNQ